MTRDNTPTRDTVTAKLDCNHYTTVHVTEVLNRSTLTCWACDNVQRRWLRFVAAGQGYWFQCLQCSYSRSYGMLPHTAQQAANAHAFRHHHDVSIRVDGHELKIIRVQAPSLLDTPPF